MELSCGFLDPISGGIAATRIAAECTRYGFVLLRLEVQDVTTCFASTRSGCRAVCSRIRRAVDREAGDPRLVGYRYQSRSLHLARGNAGVFAARVAEEQERMIHGGVLNTAFRRACPGRHPGCSTTANHLPMRSAAPNVKPPPNAAKPILWPDRTPEKISDRQIGMVLDDVLPKLRTLL